MARLLAWSPEAVEDLQAIAAYIERDSAWYANAVVSKIVETAESIPQFPELGRIVPETAVYSIRERFVHNYRLIYQIEDERILLVTIVHASRLLLSLLDANRKPGSQ